MAGIVDRSVRAAAQADGFDLYLRRLAVVVGDRARWYEIFHAAKPHHVGTGKGTRSKTKLEKRRRGHLVFYKVGRVHLQSRYGKGKTPRPRALYRKRQAEGLGQKRRRKFQNDASVQHLDRLERAVLVDARKHRPPDAKAGKTFGKDRTCKHE